MEEKEKYKAEIEARLRRFDETLHEIKIKQEERRESPPNIHLVPVLEMHKQAGAKLKEMEQADEHSWDKFKSELDDLINDIDDELRKAFAYFK